MEPHSKKDYVSTVEAAPADTDEPGPSRSLAHSSQPQARTPHLQQKHTNRLQSEEAPSQGLFQLISGLFRGNGAGQARQEVALKEAVQAIIDEHAADSDSVEPEERNLLRNILQFSEMSVSDIMIPRTDIAAVSSDVSQDELKQFVIHEQHSRMPVYEDNLDHIAGFLHIKDIAVQVFSGKPYDIASIMRQILFVPPTMKVMDLLVKMRQSGVHIAIVVDEYGGTDGLVTMEDIVEQIVGEIQDEHDEETPEENYLWLNDTTIEADARMEIEELCECFGSDIVLLKDEDEFDTVGGLVFSHLGHIPETGEQFDYPTGLRITILEAETRAVKRVRIERIEPYSDTLPAGAGK